MYGYTIAEEIAYHSNKNVIVAGFNSRKEAYDAAIKEITEHQAEYFFGDAYHPSGDWLHVGVVDKSPTILDSKYLADRICQNIFEEHDPFAEYNSVKTVCKNIEIALEDLGDSMDGSVEGINCVIGHLKDVVRDKPMKGYVKRVGKLSEYQKDIKKEVTDFCEALVNVCKKYHKQTCISLTDVKTYNLSSLKLKN